MSSSLRVEQHLVILRISDAVPALREVDVTKAVDCTRAGIEIIIEGCGVFTVLVYVAVLLIFEE